MVVDFTYRIFTRSLHRNAQPKPQQQQRDQYEFLDLSEVDDDERSRLSTALQRSQQQQRGHPHERRLHRNHRMHVNQNQINHHHHHNIEQLSDQWSSINRYSATSLNPNNDVIVLAEVVNNVVVVANDDDDDVGDGDEHVDDVMQCDYFVNQSNPMFFMNRSRPDPCEPHGKHNQQQQKSTYTQ